VTTEPSGIECLVDFVDGPRDVGALDAVRIRVE